MKAPSEYKQKEVVVLGLGMSGVAVAKLFHRFGASVTVNDYKPRHECPEAEALEELGIRVICGGHPDDLLHDGISLVIKNPGIPYTVPPVVQALRLGIELITEVEVAWHLCKGQIIGITGSNGKTTTTTWVHQMLEKAGLQSVIAGNIGRPLCEAAPEVEVDGWLLAELSSFQLKGIVDFSPRIACLLNIVETHMDYHVTMQDYVRSKLNLMNKSTEQDVVVLNLDDPICSELASTIKAKVFPFSSQQQLTFGLFILDGKILYRDENGQKHVIVSVDEIGIPGKHNAENAMAAAAIAISAGVDLCIIAEQIRQFHGVEHRLETVKTKDQVLYVNDSKATNAVALARSLETFAGPIVLIAGGMDRGADFSSLTGLIRDKVKSLIAYGETKEQFVRLAKEANVSHIYSVDGQQQADQMIDEAVRAAYSQANAGDVVLFSPACASWDLFSSYEVRGRMFKQSVHNL